MSLADRWARMIEHLRQHGRYRTLNLPAGVDFTSNDYLGYGSGKRGPCSHAPHPGHSSPGGKTRAGGEFDLPRSGLASRLLRGHHPIWDEVESALARWHGCEAVLMMSSGYMANEGLLSTVIEPHDWVASDQFNHASIIDGLRLAKAERFMYRHNDLNHLETGMKLVGRNRPDGRQLFIVTESLFSMEGDPAPLPELVKLAGRYGAYVIADEAHATGCFGPAGSGLVDAAGVRDHVLATVHTGGKALGVAGAYICGSRRLKELLINRCRQFIFTTALPPAVGGWWLEVLPFVQRDEAGRRELHRGANVFHAALAKHQVPASGNAYIIPVPLEEDQRAMDAAHQLQQAGWDIRAIRPPTVPEGTARLRISIHADHDAEILERAAAAVAHAVQRARR